MSKYPKPSPEVQEYAKELAALLGETETVPMKQVKRVVNICGIDFARQVYNETAEIEDKGGMMLNDNSRRRTRGGVFFYLVRTKVEPDMREIIFPTYKSFKPAGKQKAPIGVPLLTWEERIAIIQSLQTEQGEIKSMKVLLTGRPGSVEKRPEVVVTTMSYVASAPSLPRGIPLPPTTPTLYTVYMAPKQWEKVEESIADPADNLTIDGVCAFDPETNGMAVFATLVRSDFVEAKSREEQKALALKEKEAKAAAPKPAKAPADNAAPVAKAPKPAAPPPQPQAKQVKKSRIADLQPEPVSAAPVVQLNPNLPPEVARKLTELHASASLFRQKVATIQAKPAGQQFGLEMTQKLLKNVEDEIASLEKKHNS